MHLLTLVSRQLWTQVLVMLHVQPKGVLLLHTDSEPESAEPARRLDALLRNPPTTVDGTPATQPPRMGMERIPDGHDLQELVEALDAVVRRHGLDPSSVLLNATGGQRLMTAAATEWARLRGATLLFLDRARDITRLRFANNHWNAVQERASIDAIHRWDPKVLLELSGQSIAHPGQWITLTPQGTERGIDHLRSELQQPSRERLQELLRRVDSPDPIEIDGKHGTLAELAAAIWILRAGVPGLRTGLKVQIRPETQGVADEELDALFCHDGRLWLAEVKDQKQPTVTKRRLLHWLSDTGAPADLSRDLHILFDQLNESAMASLKLDLLAARRFGGIQAEVIRITKKPLVDVVQGFAAHHRIHCALAHELHSQIPLILNGPPRKPAPASSPIRADQYVIT